MAYKQFILWGRGQATQASNAQTLRKTVHLHLADAFIQSDLQCIRDILFFFFSMCVPWELNPQPFALLTQCSTTEPQEHGERQSIHYRESESKKTDG